MDADALSRIPWEINHTPHVVLDSLIAKSTLMTTPLFENIPHLPNAVIAVNELVIHTDFQLTKAQWREEQLKDYSISHIIKLLETNQLLAYKCNKSDPEDLKSMLRMRKDFFLHCHLLYRRAHFKMTNKQVKQFVLPSLFRKRTVMVCHEDYGHLGMDRVLILLQERYFWPKMSDDVRKFISNVTDVYGSKDQKSKRNYTQSWPHIH